MHETLARTLTHEVGKPIRQSRNELNGLLGAHRLLPRRVAPRAARAKVVFADPGQKLDERDHARAARA